MLSIRNFNKRYPAGELPVLEVPSLSLLPGIYWIKGENGSGKTSLIKSIAGLVPFEGIIEVTGLDIRLQRMSYCKAVNYAAAEPQYPGFLTGTELLHFYHAAKGGSLPLQLMEQLGATHFMTSKTAVYSSGMMKKLSLLLAFTGKPALVLLDEPFIALDTAAVEVLQKAIAAYSKNGCSFIITSHQPLNLELVHTTATFVIKNRLLLPETV